MFPRAPLVTLAALAAMGLVLKAGRLWGIAEGAGDPSLLWMFPSSIGRDLLTAAAGAALTWLVARRSARAGAVVGGLVCGLLAFFALGNAISYAVTQAPITLQRLRGDDGATLQDIALLDLGDWLPGLVVLSLAAAAAAWAGVLARTQTARTAPLAIGAALVLGLVSEGAHQLSKNRLLARVAETPLGVFAASIAHEARPPVRAARPNSRYPKRPPADQAAALWQEIEAPTTSPRTPATAPTKQPGGKKNVILLLAETLSVKHSSFGSTVDTTPFMKARAADGLVMTRAYSPYCLSIQAIYGTACSDWPIPEGTNIAGINPRIDCGEISQALAPHGVKSGLFHAGNFGFYDKLAFLGRRAYDVEVDAQVLAARDGGKWESNKWGIDDYAMVDAMLEWIDTLDKDQRFFSFLIPISAHYPYHLWRGHEAKFPGRSKKAKYHSSVALLDDTFERMMKGLEARGLLEDTAVVVIGDHGESMGEQVHESAGNRLSYETHAHVPMFVIAKDLVPAQRSDRVVGLIDIAPTLLDVLGLPPDPRHRGQSVFSPQWRDRRQFLAGKGDGVRLVGFVDHDTKFLVDVNTLAPEIYDLVDDPHELVNLAPQRPDDVARFTDAALAWRDWQTPRVKATPSLGDEIDLHAGAWQDATFSITDASGERTCVREQCAPVLTRASVRAEGSTRDCYVLALPPDGAVTIKASGPAWVKEISQLRVALLEGESTRPRVTLRGVSDGSAREAVLAGAGKLKRLEIVRPKESVEVSVSARGAAPKLCLTLGETAWRNTLKRREGARPSDGPTVDPAVDPIVDPIVDPDDEHAKALRNRN